MYLHKLKHMVKVNLPKVLAIHAKSICKNLYICGAFNRCKGISEAEVLQLY